MTSPEEMAVKRALWADWISVLASWDVTPLGGTGRIHSALICPGCHQWQIEGEVQPWERSWMWMDPDVVEAVVAAMREHLRLSPDCRVLIALTGRQVSL